jgi:peptidoglycan/LPS O-acetylase OafA/YrhL
LSTTAHPGHERLGLIDALKAIGSQLIVWHHLAFYGPMADVVAAWAPGTIEALARHARLAVQVFLVVAGFLAARQFAPGGRLALTGSTMAAVLDRYLRLVLPYAVALVITVGCTAFARRWLDHHSLPDPVDAWQLIAHLLLLQDLLDIEALSAGVWYLAIDLQLFALLLGLLHVAAWIERRREAAWPVAPWLVLALLTASLFVFNRDADWDVAAPYFFASYGLGVLAAWWAPPPGAATGGMEQPGRLPGAWLWMTLAVVATALALTIDFRARIALAAAIALAILAQPGRGSRLPAICRPIVEPVIEMASRISYSLFLVHFGVCLVVNALFTSLLPATVPVQALGLVVAWITSVLAAWLLHQHVERPALRWVAARTRRVGSALRAG